MPKASAEQTIKVRLLRDTWNGEDRIRAGAEADMPLSQALKAIKDGAVEAVEEAPAEPIDAPAAAVPPKAEG